MARFSFGVDAGPQIYSFSNSTEVTIVHNLGYRPLVYVVDGDGHQCWVQVVHNSNMELVLTFQNSLTAIAYLR